jgi:predicted ABC-type transport system involved in lysophospholipase L1 biosynthesis ATPase subunit
VHGVLTDGRAETIGSGPVVRFDRVSKTFGGGKAALDDASFEVRAGEVVVLLGLSGSGKSTLPRHVDGLLRPTSARVYVLGTDVGTAASGKLRRPRRRVGFVFQQFHLVGRLTVLENVCTGALGRLRMPRLGLISYSREIRSAALAQLDRVGLADRAFDRADTLPVGSGSGSRWPVLLRIWATGSRRSSLITHRPSATWSRPTPGTPSCSAPPRLPPCGSGRADGRR